MFDDDFANRREIRQNIDALILTVCGPNRSRIIAMNAKLKAHYHPDRPRSGCSEALLLSILAGLQAEALSTTA